MLLPYTSRKDMNAICKHTLVLEALFQWFCLHGILKMLYKYKTIPFFTKSCFLSFKKIGPYLKLNKALLKSAITIMELLMKGKSHISGYQATNTRA